MTSLRLVAIWFVSWLSCSFLCFGADGLYVTDGDGFEFVNSSGVVTAKFSSGGAGPASGLAWDGKGGIYASFGTSIGAAQVSSNPTNLPALGIIMRFTLDGRSNVVARGFWNPNRMAFDSDGNLYVTDWWVGIIGKVTPTQIEPQWATLDQSKRPQHPIGVACDNKGNVYVAVMENSWITMISPTGAMSAFGTGLTNVLSHSGQGSLVNYSSPQDLAFDTQENLYVSALGASLSEGTVQRITPAGAVTTFASGFNQPIGLAIDTAGNLDVANVGINGSPGFIDRVTPSGAVSLFATNVSGAMVAGPAPLFTTPKPPSDRPVTTVVTLAGDGQPGDAPGTGAWARFNAPNGGFVDTQGNVWIADNNNHRIKRMTPAGAVSDVAGAGVPGFADGPAATAQFHNPTAVCVDQAGNAYVADFGNNRIRRIGTNGLVSTIAGNSTAGYFDGLSTNALFNAPNDLVIDQAGDLFVTEFLNNTVRKISPTGLVTTWAGNGTAGYLDGVKTNALFNQPGGIAIDLAGNLYVTEWSGQRIRKIDPRGSVTTIAGDGTVGLLDSWGLQARFFNPDGIVVGSDGNIYIADNGNNAIRRLDSDGFVFTIAGTGASGFVDGAGTQAQFAKPTGIGWRQDGTLFVTDGGNNAARQIVWGLTNTAGFATRQLPGSYIGGGELQVLLVAHPPPGVHSYTLTDNFPTGWTALSASDGGTLDNIGGKVTFGPIFDSQVRVITYTVEAPPGDSGIKQFSGTFTSDSVAMAIGGNSQIAPAQNSDLLGPINATLATGGTLALTFDGTVSLTNTLEVTRDTVLDGAGHSVTLSGNNQIRLFNVHTNVSLTLLNLTLADGLAKGVDSLSGNDPGLIAYGGCIDNEGGQVTLSNCVLTSNFAVGGNILVQAPNFSGITGGAAYGGAIFSRAGSVTLRQTKIGGGGAQGGQGFNSNTLSSGPGGAAYGGGICALGGSVSILMSTFTSNNVVGGPEVANGFLAQPPGTAFGGALYSSNGIVALTNSTFIANVANSPNSYYTGSSAGGGAVCLRSSTGSISGSVFEGNAALGSDPALGISSGGGALFSDRSVLLTGCQFWSNTVSGSVIRCGPPAPAYGGAISSSGVAFVNETSFAFNTAIGEGNGNIPVAQECSLAGPAFGGAFYNVGQLTLVSSTFELNSVAGGWGYQERVADAIGIGGALYASGSTFATNDTFFGNLGTNSSSVRFAGPAFGTAMGGAIGASNSMMVLVNVTLAGNNVISNGFGGGIWSTNSAITVRNTILANIAGNCAGPLIDGGNNISSDGTCNFTNPSSFNNTDPVLGPLDDYGGPTLTMPLLAGSPAIDHGNDAVAPAADQRGHARPYGKASDVGAFESSPPYTIRGDLNSFWSITNVSLTASGSTLTTANRGAFAINGLAPGTYLLAPALTNYLFTPAIQPVTVGPDALGLQFTAYQLGALTPTPSTNGLINFVVAGQAGTAWQLDTSTNLSDWQPLSAGVVGTNGLLPFVEPVNRANPSSFYRALRQ